jgi:hypothetical protein
MRVGDGAKILGESGGSDQVVDFALFGDNVCDGFINRGWVGDVGIVSADSRNPLRHH